MFSFRISAVSRALTGFIFGPLLCIGASNSEYLVDAWQTADGLPQNSIAAIAQTPDGYLWLGTFNGLVRFDGGKFQVFPPATAPVAGNNWIQTLYTDRSGRLWIGTDAAGVSCYDNGTFRSRNPDGRIRKVVSIIEREDGVLFFLTSTGLLRLTGERWDEIAVPHADFTQLEYEALAPAPSGEIFFSAGMNLYSIVENAVELRHSFTERINTLAVDTDGTVICGLADGRIAELTGVTPHEIPRYTEFAGVSWHQIFRAPNGDLWATAHEGLFRRRGDDWLHLTEADGLVTSDVLRIYLDRENNFWLGTNGGGLNRLRQRIVELHSTKNGLASNDIISVFEDREGRIWTAGFRAGVAMLKDEKWEQLKLPSDTERRLSDIMSLLQTRDGMLWIGGRNELHYRWDGRQMEPFKIWTPEALRMLFEDRDGGLWIGSSAGLERWSEQKNDGVRVSQTEGGGGADLEEERGAFLRARRKYDIQRVHCVAQDRSGDIWVGTQTGLHRIAPDNSIDRFSIEDGLLSNVIHSLHADSEGHLWIGTVGGGLSRLADGKFTTLTPEHGLPSATISQLLEDDAGYLWFGHPKGITRARKVDLLEAMDGLRHFVVTRTFGPNEGIPQPECAGGFQPTCLKDRQGKLWFCTISGLVAIDPKKIVRNEVPPPLEIEAVELQDSRRHRTTLPIERDPISIPAGTAWFEIRFTGLSLTAADKVQFRHRLEGLEENWLEAGTRRFAHYTHVPPGNYRFHVIAANEDGVWNTTGASIWVRVQPHFWQTLWFRLMVGLGVGGLIAGAVWLRIRTLARLHALRLRIARDLHDEAGSNLASILLLSRQAAKRPENRDTSRQQIAEIEQIAMATAESIRQLVWLIAPEFDTLDQMLQQIERVANRLLPDVHVEFNWRVNHCDRILPLHFRSQFFLALKEILHNVAKHSDASRLVIDLTEENGMFVLTVRDNGIGFDPHNAPRGHGMESLRNRALQLSGEFSIQSAPGAGGTTVILKAHLKQ